MANKYPIVNNCNFESRDDVRGTAINKAMKALNSGRFSDCENLVEAMESLEEILADCADKGDVESVEACRAAEREVESAWNSALATEEVE